MTESIGGEGDRHTHQAALLAAVADPLRLRILAITRRPRPVQEICEALGGVAQPRVSHHLAVLREQGLVSVERRGRQRLYGWADPEPGPVRDILQLLSRWFVSTGTPPRVASGPPAPAMPARRPQTTTAELEDFLL